MSYLVPVSERVTGPQRPAAPSRPGSGPALLTKAEKRAAAKAAKERAVAAAKRRRVMAIVGAAVAVVAVIGLVVWLAVRSDGPATDSTASNATGATATGAAPTAAPTTAAAFPPLPAGADPALSTKPVVKAGTGTVSKLAVTTLIEGKGAATQTGQQITVNYVGVTYKDGKEFDASWNSSQAFTFALGGNVIPGWNQGLVGVKVGSRVQLDIPSDLAYGDNPSNGPAGALRFVVDVLAAS